MKKTFVMNCLIPLMLVLLTTFLAIRQGDDKPHEAPRVMGEAAIGQRDVEPTQVWDAAQGRTRLGAPTDLEKPLTTDDLPVICTEAGDLPAGGSEAESDAIESAGVLNRLELFDF